MTTVVAPVQPPPTAAATGHALLVASRALVGIAARSLADVDVTLPQWRALVVISSRPSVTVNDLADALAVHPSTATRLCDRLVAKRLVRRAQSREDRRITELDLSAAGRRLVSGVTADRRASLVAIAGRMSPAARAALLEGLAEFAEAAGEPVGVDLLGWGGDA
jgi:DNA-binding MarR family transcriptional regulator